MNSVDFSKPQRESVLATVFSMGFFYRKLIAVIWPLLVVYLFKGNNSTLFSSWWTYIGLLTLLIVIAIRSFLSWKYFFFYVKNKEFVLEKGYLKKEIISVPIEKIISVNTNQKLLHQLLNVVEVQIDSVGSDQKEIKLRAVKKHFAEALTQALSNYKNIRKEESEQPLQKESEKKTIVSLSFNSLLKIGITRNHLQGLLIVLVFINQIRYQVQDFFEDEKAKLILTETLNILEHSDLIVWITLVIFLIFLALLISIIRTFLSYFDLQMLQIKKAFILQSGLLKRKSITVPFSRIQAVKKTTNPLQYLLKITTLQLVQASSKEQRKETEKVLIPGCALKQDVNIHHTVFPTFNSHFLELKPHWAFRNRLFFTRVLLLIPTSILSFLFPHLWWLLILALCWAIVDAEIAYRYRTYKINTDLLQVNSGGITRVNTLLEQYKIQTVHLTQTFFQRKRNTATLQLGLAGTSVSISHISYKKAVRIKDYLLHKIHNDQRSWM